MSWIGPGKQPFSWPLVSDPQHIFRRNISAVAIALWMLLAIFLPQQFDGQVAVVLELLADIDKIRLLAQPGRIHPSQIMVDGV